MYNIDVPCECILFLIYFPHRYRKELIHQSSVHIKWLRLCSFALAKMPELVWWLQEDYSSGDFGVVHCHPLGLVWCLQG